MTFTIGRVNPFPWWERWLFTYIW